MAEPFPDLTPALGTIMMRIMAEVLSSDTTAARNDQLDAVRNAIRAAWPDECTQARLSTVWQSHPDGGSQALYEKRDFQKSTSQ